MKSSRRIWPLILGVLAWGAVFPAFAQAYLDPGTGSYVFQVLVGTVLGGLFFLKAFWKNIKNSLTNRFSRRAKD